MRVGDLFMLQGRPSSKRLARHPAHNALLTYTVCWGRNDSTNAVSASNGKHKCLGICERAFLLPFVWFEADRGVFIHALASSVKLRCAQNGPA